MSKFDPSAAEASLAALPEMGRSLFAVTCATRQSEGYRAYERVAGGDGSQVLSRALDLVWSKPLAKHEDVATVLGECDRLLDNEGEAWEDNLPWAQGNVLAVIAALRGSATPSPAICAQPAIHAIDALDLAVIYLLGLDMNIAENEARVERHPAIEREIERQARDLADLARAFGDEEAGLVIGRRLRSRAEAESIEFLP